MKCTSCGSEMTTGRENYQYDEVGLSCVTLVDLEVSRCSHCGDYEVSIPAIAQLHALICRSVVMKTSRLLPEEIRFLRKHLGLSQTDLARILAVAMETVNRWENGKAQMSVTVERYLRLVAATRQPIAQYDKELQNVALGKATCTMLRFARTEGDWHSLKAA